MWPFRNYLNWLDGDAPQRKLDAFPELDEDGQSKTTRGLYVVGDLTGIPLLKLAADGGRLAVESIASDPSFSASEDHGKGDLVDLVIIGAGVSGVAAAEAAMKAGMSYDLLEKNVPLSTIRDFTRGKPISAYPLEMSPTTGLNIVGSTKEVLLANLDASEVFSKLKISTGEKVTGIEGQKGSFRVQTDGRTITGKVVIVAIGKTGDPRKLDVVPQNPDMIKYVLSDPRAFEGKRVMVMGGGDSAAESALMLAKTKDTKVTLSYRGNELIRPKPENLRKLARAQKDGRLELLLGTQITGLGDRSATLTSPEWSEPREIPLDTVLVQIGSELPWSFLKKAGIQISGGWSTSRKWMLAALLLFAGFLYFGKSAGAVDGDGLVNAVLGAPGVYLSRPWYKAIPGLGGWICAAGFVVAGTVSLGIILAKRTRYFASPWQAFKTLYLIAAAILVYVVFVLDDYAGQPLAGKGLGFWYTSLYSLTILVFGIRRMWVRRTRYITAQTTTLIVVQILFLFLLPEMILPLLGENGLVPAWAMENLFPNGAYWRSYGFILAWPLFFSNVLYGQPTTAWLVISLVQTFVIIPLFVWRFGKGAYCGWICSCGGLAETLGDEYRHLAPKGSWARKVEHSGQAILIAVAVLTIWNLVFPDSFTLGLDTGRYVYKILVDVALAGVVGVGAYFFFSGRMWCRFFCPLAALMHIYTKFSVYRINPDGRCISCDACSRYCHMGIDVMGYAAANKPMDNYECVRCSACIQVCPVDNLAFGLKGSSSSVEGPKTA